MTDPRRRRLRRVTVFARTAPADETRVAARPGLPSVEEVLQDPTRPWYPPAPGVVPAPLTFEEAIGETPRTATGVMNSPLADSLYRALGLRPAAGGRVPRMPSAWAVTATNPITGRSVVRLGADLLDTRDQRLLDSAVVHEVGHVAERSARSGFYPESGTFVPMLAKFLESRPRTVEDNEEVASRLAHVVLWLREGRRDLGSLDPTDQQLARMLLQQPIYAQHPLNTHGPVGARFRRIGRGPVIARNGR